MERSVTVRSSGQGDGRGVRDLLRLCLSILGARKLAISSFRKLAWTARVLTVVLTVAGLVFVWYTPTPARIAPRMVQVLVALSILLFGFVGFWMLCHRGQVSHALSWMFCAGGFLGALVYACATYSNLGVEGRHLAGGLTVGWVGDLLFLPGVLCLLPAFLAIIPDGRPQSRRWGWAVGVPDAIAGVLLFLAALFEPHLVTRPLTSAPLGGLKVAAASGALQVAGLSTALLTTGIGFLALRARLETLEDDDPRSWQVRWYRFGCAISLVALLPYVFTALVNTSYVPRAYVLARAWGAAVAAAIPIAAVPATERWPWAATRMKLLMRAAIIAGIVTSLHELLVKRFADALLNDNNAVLAQRVPLPAEARNGLLITYGVTVLVAVLIEPGASLLHHAFDGIADRWPSRREPSNLLLEEALEHVRASRKHLERRRKREDGFLRRGRDGDASGPDRRASRRRTAAGAILRNIDRESADARRVLTGLQRLHRLRRAAGEGDRRRPDQGLRLRDLPLSSDGSGRVLVPGPGTSRRRPGR